MPSAPSTACGLSICSSNRSEPLGNPCTRSSSSKSRSAASTWVTVRNFGMVVTKPRGTPDAPSSTSSRVRTLRRRCNEVRPLIRMPSIAGGFAAIDSARNVRPALRASASSVLSPRQP
ncbi:Uncharacterised protein [Mycobacteroides abscessus subsp. abscessus]|nr:Uncharacterised protein [Mycobacteroides abscessus subsp. abscessus]